MSALDEYFDIFREGADDAKYRQRALDTGRKLAAALGKLKPTDLDFPKAGKTITSVDLGELLKDPELEDLQVWFVARDENENASRRGVFVNKVKSGAKRIELYYDIPHDAMAKVTPDVWKSIVLKKAPQMFDQLNEIFWHEFVHYMDMKRMGPSSQRAAFAKVNALGGVSNPKKYFNDPVEYNAFVQQGLTRVEDHLSKVGSWVDAQKLIGKNPTEFYRLVLRVLSPGMKQVLDDKFKNKLKKRVAQMWNDTMRRFNGGGKNV